MTIIQFIPQTWGGLEPRTCFKFSASLDQVTAPLFSTIKRSQFKTLAWKLGDKRSMSGVFTSSPRWQTGDWNTVNVCGEVRSSQGRLKATVCVGSYRIPPPAFMSASDHCSVILNQLFVRKWSGNSNAATKCPHATLRAPPLHRSINESAGERLPERRLANEDIEDSAAAWITAGCVHCQTNAAGKIITDKSNAEGEHARPSFCRNKPLHFRSVHEREADERRSICLGTTFVSFWIKSAHSCSDTRIQTYLIISHHHEEARASMCYFVTKISPEPVDTSDRNSQKIFTRQTSSTHSNQFQNGRHSSSILQTQKWQQLSQLSRF